MRLSTFAFKFNLRHYIMIAGHARRPTAGPYTIRPILVYHFLRRVLMLCPQLCMGVQPVARFPAWSADALSATLYRHFT
jgi:hypothetical protein